MKMLLRFTAVISAVLLSALFFATPASAQATRTWISGTGSDANPCSRTAPCKTFAGAIAQTAAGGEIDCLDPGGFGALTITKSITLDCGGGIGGQAGSVLVAGTNGIVISAGAGDVVTLRNLTINGIAKGTSPGLAGVKFLSGQALILEHVGVFGFGAGATSGTNAGVDFEPSGNSSLSMHDMEVQFCLADGVLIKPGSAGSATVTLDHVSSTSNGQYGLRVEPGSNVTLSNSNLSENVAGVEARASTGEKAATVTIATSVISGNSTLGLRGSGPDATIVVGGSIVTGNPSGLLAANGAVIKSFKDNYFFNGATGNANGTPTGTVSKL